MQIESIKKRDGKTLPFELKKIELAILKAMQAAGEGSEKDAHLIAQNVEHELENIRRHFSSFIPDVEGVQDIVERCLMLGRFMDTAKGYILYREKRAKLREKTGSISERYRQLATESRKYFDSVYSEFIYLRTYARWVEEEGRRETWIETVDRFMEFFRDQSQQVLEQHEFLELRNAILNQEVMPSMRLMQFAGDAARATHVCIYNCAFIAPTSIRDFAEALYILMCGTGLGFSVEDQCIQELPLIKIKTEELLPEHRVADSREGWAEALRLGMEAWYSGKDIGFDYSEIRPAGARLRTFGGRASGPEPLKELLEFTKAKIIKNQGSRLPALDAHDILTKIGQVVVAGGVRRSAQISLSDLRDDSMRNAKRGHFYIDAGQRAMANNSAVYKEKPSNPEFLREWLALIESNSGERGIFNRGGLIKTLPNRRLEHLDNDGYVQDGKIVGVLGTNPCGEIILKGSGQFCNLSEVICRESDTKETLIRKLKLATLIGTFQSTLTNFKYLSPKWKKNCEDERLLGVSLTGQWDCDAIRDPSFMSELKEIAIKYNIEYAKRFDINPSTAITTVKPSGNVSQVVNCASGMHPRFAPYYIRRVRISSTDALYHMLKDQGVPAHPEVGQSPDNATTFVLEFPIKSPVNAVTQGNQTAIEQLEYWKMVKLNFTEHNPSVTIYVEENEWIKVASWIDQNWDFIGGISFLPKNNMVYRLAPYEEITRDVYEKLCSRLRQVDLSLLPLYEVEDQTEVKRELACVGGSCEL